MIIPKNPRSHWLLTLGIGFSLAALPLSLASAQDAAASPAAAAKEKSAAWTARETTFVKKAGAGNAAEVKLGQLALTNAESEDAKDFANTMIKDHGAANTDLEAIAKSHDIPFPPPEMEKSKATYEKMSKLKGAEFDKAYIADAVTDHTMDVAEYKMAADSVKDAELKGYVEKVKPIVEGHLKMAKDMKAKMMSGKKS